MSGRTYTQYAVRFRSDENPTGFRIALETSLNDAIRVRARYLKHGWDPDHVTIVERQVTETPWRKVVLSDA